MNLRSFGLVAMLVASPAYADEAMTVVQDLGTKWQTAYNSGDAGKVADLYMQDAVWSRPLGTVKGKPEIEKTVTNLMKQSAKITVTPVAAHQNGNVVWGYGDFMFAEGASGHYGITVVNDAGSWHVAMHISNVTPPKQQ